MNATLWRLESIDGFACKINPLDKLNEVTNTLLNISKMRMFFSDQTFNGYTTLLWNIDQGLVLNYKEEPEFGDDKVYSISFQNRKRVSDKNFYKLYVQIFEIFGTTLLENERFVTVKEFKGRL